MDSIYLDHNGSAPVATEVLEAMQPWLMGIPGNPASGHSFGKRGKEAIEHARVQLAALLSCAADELVFTSGGTESDNLAVKGLAEEKAKGHIITVATEHPAVLGPARYLEKRGFGLDVVGVDSEGFVDPAEIAAKIRPDTILVSVMLSNNEVGTTQPIQEISRIARARKIVLHCDAAQVLGKEPVSVEDLGVDMLTVAGHKLNAPKGVGALYLRKGIVLAPQLHGAGHERGLRSGTQDVLEIVGLGAAAERYNKNAAAITKSYRELRDFFEQELFAAIPQASLNGPKERRLVNTTNIAFEGVKSGDLIAACPEVACAPGAACHKDHTNPSHVLAAMGLSMPRIESSIRFSLGYGTTREQLSRAVSLLKTAYDSLAR